jgi:UDP:flavonoid glycosyltransferase YjiC (YdhE family)
VSRFLFAMWEGGGTVPPEMGIASRLLLRNHNVHIIGDPTIEDATRRIGATFTRWREAPHVTSLRPEDVLVRDWEIHNPFKLFRAMADALLVVRRSCSPAKRWLRSMRSNPTLSRRT